MRSKSPIEVPDDAYGSGWNGSTEVPTKNAIYDKIQTLSGAGAGSRQVLLLNNAGIRSPASTGDQTLLSVVIPGGTLAADGDTLLLEAGFWRADAGSRTRISRVQLSDGTNTQNFNHSSTANNQTTIYRLMAARAGASLFNWFGEVSIGTENTYLNGSSWARRAGALSPGGGLTMNWGSDVTVRFITNSATGTVLGDMVLGFALVELIRAP